MLALVLRAMTIQWGVVKNIGQAARLLAVSFFLWGIGEGLWLYILALYPERLGASDQQTGFFLAMQGAGRLAAIMPFTLALDRFNPRTVMYPGYLAGILGMGLLAIAPSWQFAALGMFIYGCSAPTLIPFSVYLSDAIRHDPTRHPSTQLHTILTFTWAANALGIILSPAIGGYIGQHISLRAVFGVSMVWFTLSMLCVYFTPRFPTQKKKTFSRENYALAQQPAFIARNALFALILTAPLIGYSLVPRFLEDLHGYSTESIGSFGVMSALGIAFVNLALGQTQAWRGFLIGQAMTGVALLLFLTLHWPATIALAYFAFGAWYSFRPFTTSLITEITPTDQHGFAFTVIDMLYALSMICAPFIAGLLYAQAKPLPLMVGLGATLLAVSVTVGIVLRRNRSARFAYNKALTADIRQQWEVDSRP